MVINEMIEAPYACGLASAFHPGSALLNLMGVKGSCQLSYNISHTENTIDTSTLPSITLFLL